MAARIVVLRERIDPQLLAELVDEIFGDMLKFVVDIERGIIAVGGEMHVDAESVLLEAGSRQEDMWGGNYFPAEPADRCVECSSLINIRPAQDNSGMQVNDPALQRRIGELVRKLIGEGAPRP